MLILKSFQSRFRHLNTQKIQVSIAMRTWASLSPQETICKEEIPGLYFTSIYKSLQV